MFHRLLLLCLSLSAYDCLKIAADGPSVFPFSKHPLFLFSKKPPSTNFGYYVPALLFSLPHPPTFRYYSFLFGEGGLQVGRQRRCRRARQNTHKSRLQQPLVLGQARARRLALVNPSSISCGPSAAFNHPLPKKKKDMGCAFICPASAGQNPLKLIHTSDTKMQITKTVIVFHRGESRAEQSPKTKSA